MFSRSLLSSEFPRYLPSLRSFKGSCSVDTFNTWRLCYFLYIPFVMHSILPCANTKGKQSTKCIDCVFPRQGLTGSNTSMGSWHRKIWWMGKKIVSNYWKHKGHKSFFLYLERVKILSDDVKISLFESIHLGQSLWHYKKLTVTQPFSSTWEKPFLCPWKQM